MTCILTIACPEGIVLAGDRRISRELTDGNWEFAERDKIYGFRNGKMGASYWGLAEIREEETRISTSKYLKDFDRKYVESGDDVHSVADKLKDALESVRPKIRKRMGVHATGYSEDNGDKYPVIRHVFHESWNEPGQFVNEYCNTEYHLLDGGKVEYPYDPWRAVFNGDPIVPNVFFNYFGSLPYGLDRYIVIDKLSLNECVQLANLLVSTAGEILKYMYETREILRKVPQVIKGISVAKITRVQGFNWVTR